tara:strand:+ start:1711 stop:2325 length:615 start_codon:yes stop_codon:yes gene_type:complete
MIGIVDYGLGNLVSVAAAVSRLDFEPTVTVNPDVLADCDKIILPGVGAFGDGMRNLAERSLIEPLRRIVVDEGKPILGICLGAQLISNASDEFGVSSGLGWIDAHCRKLTSNDPSFKVPHVGWNNLIQKKDDPIFCNIPDDALFYYVHSYYVDPSNDDLVIGECEYGSRVTSVLRYRNIYATQFHPEKSQRHGLTLLQNFLTGA